MVFNPLFQIRENFEKHINPPSVSKKGLYQICVSENSRQTFNDPKSILLFVTCCIRQSKRKEMSFFKVPTCWIYHSLTEKKAQNRNMNTSFVATKKYFNQAKDRCLKFFHVSWKRESTFSAPNFTCSCGSFILFFYHKSNTKKKDSVSRLHMRYPTPTPVPNSSHSSLHHPVPDYKPLPQSDSSLIKPGMRLIKLFKQVTVVRYNQFVGCMLR